MESEDTVLIIVDMQDKLINNQKFPIYERDKTVANIMTLVKAANIFKMPIFVMNQINLGDTIPEIQKLVDENPKAQSFTKSSFSCLRADEFVDEMPENVILCGIETHICIIQSAIDLFEDDFYVQIVRDATSSHSKENFESAIERANRDGIAITTTEMLIYELLQDAKSDEFKDILKIVKDMRELDE